MTLKTAFGVRSLLLLLLLILPTIARCELIPTSEADFGMVKEADGPATIRVYLRNDGSSPEAILKVRPSCGCTAAEFRKDAVAPGDSLWIDLTYNPSRRPGRFEKTVKIYPAEGEMFRIPITGTVMASPETVASMFPVDAGLLHLSESKLMTLSPLSTESRNLWIDVYNDGVNPVEFSLESDSGDITAETFSSPVAPGEKGMAGVTLNPLKESRTGHLEYQLTLLMTTPDGETQTFPITLISEKP